MEFLRRHRIVLGLMLGAGLLSFLPVLNAFFVIGDAWRGVPQSYGDEILYYNQIKEIADGNLLYGNQYLYEHSGGLTLVIFAGHWLAAIPLLLGLSLVPALVLNFFVWSMILAALGYWLLRELDLSKPLSALGSLAAYLSVYGLMLRPSSRQEVFPFFVLFYIALARFLRRPTERSSIVFLGIATGATFYVFSYLWQTAVITLGLIFLWSLWRRHWPLMRALLKASALGGTLGAPALLYMLYLHATVPHFLESLSRFGLVATHLPMAEVVYSGGWIGIVLLASALVARRLKGFLQDAAFARLLLFIAATGLGLWVMQGSNLVTGKLLETGEHIRPFIGPWLAFAGVPLFAYLWGRRREITGAPRWLLAVAAVAVAIGSLISMKVYFYPYVDAGGNRAAWVDQQSYAAPLRWLEAAEGKPVVVWSRPNHPITLHVPSLTKHYVLFAQPAIFTLTSDEELRERYLVANYFSEVSVQTLRENLSSYVGRQDAFHKAKTIERGIKLCRLFMTWKTDAECGVPPTSADLFGDAFFEGLEKKFSDDIRPNIRAYLQKYHVSYVLKDALNNPEMQPETLGAVKVWNDERYEIYKLP